MLETILKTTEKLTLETLNKLEESMEFTLAEHYEERINFHIKMLNYYFKEKDNEKLAT